jgi:hypothetical protein
MPQGVQRLVAVPQLGSPLELQRLSGFLHFVQQLVGHLVLLALQHQDRLVDALAVRRRTHGIAAPAVAVAHLEVETGAVFADVPWKFQRTPR